MAAVQLADGGWRIPLRPADGLDAFLLSGDDGTLTLVDAGRRAAARKLLATRKGCTDVRQSRASAARLGELDVEVAGFAHGAPVSTGAQAALRAFLAGRPR